MAYHFEFRRYRLPLRVPVRTAHEVWNEREGLLVRLERDGGQVGWGEVAPIPAFGTETVAMAEAACRAVGEWPTEVQLDAVPASLGCMRRALADTRGEVGAALAPTDASDADYRAVAALLPAGRAAGAVMAERAESGFRVFKWKVGVGEPDEELGLLDELCGALPHGGKLRLDANGAWDRRRAERWLERCAERPIEFVEQPCFAPVAAGAVARQRADDLLLGLAQDFPTPLALDESLVGDGDVARWLAAGWPGWYVVKPSLLGDLTGTLDKLAAARATVVFSSALETGVGARNALRAAFAWTGEKKALGFGVWPLFQDARFDGPVVAPFLRRGDGEKINPEELWSALS